MSLQVPHTRLESGPGLEADTSGSSSIEDLRKGDPTTPPQVRLDFEPVTISGSPAFSDLFPWMQQGEPKSDHPPATGKEAEDYAAISAHLTRGRQDSDSMTTFQQRDVAYAPSQCLQTSPFQATSEPITSLGLFHEPSEMQPASSLGGNSAAAAAAAALAVHPGMLRPSMDVGGSTSSGACPSTTEVQDWGRCGERQGHFTPLEDLSSTEPRRRSASNASIDYPLSQAMRVSQDYTSQQAFNTPTSLLRSPPLRNSAFPASGNSPRLDGRPLSDTATPPFEATRRPEKQVLDIFADDKIPGYQVRKRGSHRSAAMAVRIPRQLVGWKAVLMDASGLLDCAFNNAESTKKSRRASKVIGKQGWEVRQEAMKNSYDFRKGSGIYATMHAGHRLFKHDWHVIVKDGSKYVWRMDKHALALHREEDDIKVAEFCKAIPSHSNKVESGSIQAGSLDLSKRIGSFTYDDPPVSATTSSEPDIFDMELALASLMAVFGARGGPKNISAAFEPSADPLRKVLEQQRQETPDREEVMLALPRPGFARDTESILSDTTDEDAESSYALPRRRPQAVTEGHRSSRSPRSPSAQMPSHDTVGPGHVDSRAVRGRKRISSFFGLGNAPGKDVAQATAGAPLSEDKPLTEAERIARHYRRYESVL